MSEQNENRPRSRLLTAGEVAELLQVSESWIYAHAHANGAKPELPSIRMGGTVRFREEDIEEFIEQCRTKARRRGLVA